MANLPNLLTGLRLVLVPVFLLFLFAGDGHQTGSRITAFIIFAVAVITDRFDGALARNYNMVTEFGKLADPIADKMLIGAALIGLSMLGDLPWWVTAVILVREIGVTVLRFAVISRGSSRPAGAANSRHWFRRWPSGCSSCRCTTGPANG